MSEEQDTTVQDTEDVGQEDTSKAVEDTSEPDDSQEKNWRNLRDNYKREKQAREALEEFVVKNLDKLSDKQQQQVATSEPDYEMPDDWIRGEDFKSWETKTLDKKMEAKLDALLAKREKERAEQEMPNRIKSTMPDYLSVCSAENIAWLESNDPDTADAIAAVPDKYKQARLAYNYIKKAMPNQAGKSDKVKAEANKAKPQSSSAVSQQPVGPAVSSGVMDQKRKQQLYNDMVRCSRGG